MQQTWVRVVVGLGDPDEVGSGKVNAFVPLRKWGATVMPIAMKTDTRVVEVALDDAQTAVCGGIIEQQQLEVLKGLLQHRAKATVKKARVIVVGDNDRDTRHGSAFGGHGDEVAGLG